MAESNGMSSYKSLIEMLDKSIELYADRPLFGTKREGIYEWTTYKQFGQKVDALRAGLSSLGVSSGDKVAVISKNTEEWAISAYATYGLCGQHIPMYETQMPSEWEYIVSDCEAKVLIVANKTIFEETKNFPNKIKTLEHVVLVSGDIDGEFKTFDELMKILEIGILVVKHS